MMANGASIFPEIRDMLRESGKALGNALDKANENKRLELQNERLRAQHIGKLAQVEQSKLEYERQRAANAAGMPAPPSLTEAELGVEPEPELDPIEPTPAPTPEPAAPVVDVASLLRL